MTLHRCLRWLVALAAIALGATLVAIGLIIAFDLDQPDPAATVTPVVFAPAIQPVVLAPLPEDRDAERLFTDGPPMHES